MCAVLISNGSGWHTLTTDHTVLPTTNMFMLIWNQPLCLYSSAAEHHCPLAGTHLPSSWG